VENYHIYRDSEDSVWIVMQTDTTGIGDAYDFVSNISKMLEKRLQKSWKILPDPTLPDSYNIFVLPSSAI
jgi:MinD-like ATPase involved in chromosome partitioning or flagellar assembly